MNKIEKKLREFLELGVTCSGKAQEYLEDWLRDLQEEFANSQKGVQK